MGTLAMLRGFLPVPLFRPSTETITGGSVYLDANLENEKTFTATVDTRIDPPVNPQMDGQRVRFRGVASGGTRAITVASSIAVGTGVSRGPYSLPVGQLLVASLEWSATLSAWFLTAITTSGQALPRDRGDYAAGLTVLPDDSIRWRGAQWRALAPHTTGAVLDPTLWACTGVLPYVQPQPGVGSLLAPQNVTTFTNVAPTSGTLALVPLTVSAPLTITGLATSVGGAQVGGAVTTTLAIYPSNPTGSLPDLTAIVASGPVALTATGLVVAAVSATLQPGRYWTGMLAVSTTTPTTAPLTITAGSTALSVPGLGMTTATKALVATGLTALPTTQIALTATATAPPLVAVQIA